MNRSAALVLLLVLASCHRGPDAVRARVQLAPGVFATCVEVQVLSNAGTVLATQLVERAQTQQELRVALFQDALPDDIQLWARAFWGKAPGCADALFFNGQSERVATRFNGSGIESTLLKLEPPSELEDVDRDGFVAHDRGGPDPDDTDPGIHP